MGTTNVANWDVSYIDVNGVYNGGVSGDLTTGDGTTIIDTSETTAAITCNSVTAEKYFGKTSLYAVNGAASLGDTLSIISNITALTLADGESDGAIARFVCLDATSSCVLTPANATLFTSITFDAVQEYAELVWSDDTNGWVIFSTNGTVA